MYDIISQLKNDIKNLAHTYEQVHQEVPVVVWFGQLDHLRSEDYLRVVSVNEQQNII